MEAPSGGASAGRRPPAWPLLVALLLAPLMLLWTLPQTMVGLAIFLLRRLQGHRARLYRFGPFLFLVTHSRGPLSSGISLGLLVFAETPGILRHEFCHLFTALWLAWLYLPAYGIEYAALGHDRSPHERLTCWLERRIKWAVHPLGRLF